MIKRSSFKVTVVLAALMLAGCDALGFKTWEWNQRLVLEVETPRGLLSGGSVIAVQAGTSPKWAPGEGRGGMGSSIKGEASFVEVAPRQYLFALLDPDQARELALTLFFPEPAPDTFERAERLETMRATRAVPRERYPLLVTFTDITDPKTVRRVDPDNLAATFGPSVSIKRITLEITDEAVTEGTVEMMLPWLRDPAVMENPGWRSLPIESRRAIGGLLSHYPDLKGS